MATRIEIELTSLQDEGRTFTWRAAGARQPKGVVDSTLLPAGSQVGDELRVEAEMDLDGIRITQVLPPKAKDGKKVETLELIARDEGPLVTQVLAEGGRGRGDRGDRRGGRRDRPRADGDRDRPRGDGERPRGDRGDRGGSGGRRDGRGGGERRDGGRPRTPSKPKLPPKPKAPRLKAGKANRSELIESLPEEQKAVAQELLRGGLQAVRQGLEKQNEQRKAEGQGAIDEGPIVTLAEQLLVKVRAAEWRDRAEAALEQAEVVDLRDLRTVVTAADGAAKDDESRALAARLRTALNERLDADQQAWVAEVVEMLDDDRVVRALHLSSRPPKAGAPLPPEVALRLVEAANASMSGEISTDRWIYILDALAHSPVRRHVVPVSLPANVSDELKGAIARHGTRLPEIAQIFGIEPDPKAGRPETRRKRRPGSKPKPDRARGAAKGEPLAEAPAAPDADQVTDVPEAVQQAPTDAPAADAVEVEPVAAAPPVAEQPEAVDASTQPELPAIPADDDGARPEA